MAGESKEPATPAAPVPGSVTLYDRETNAPVVVDAEHAHDAILSGQLNYAPGTRVPVRVGGKIGTVDADELGDAVAKYGATPVTSKAFHEHELQAQYGSTPQAALAFGVNALDSATIGLSNAAIGGLGGKDARQYIRGITEANPAAATAGDVAGFVAPIAADVLSGGALTPGIAAAEAARAGEKALARGAASAAEKGLARTAAETAILGPTRAVSAVGDVAEGAARALVGKNAESAAGRLAQNIIAGGARGVAEGGIYGVGAEVGHQYLQDNPDLTGEALGTAWVHGALLGGAFGGAIHGVSGMLSRRAPKALAGIEESGLKAAEGGPYRAASAASAAEQVERAAMPGAARESTVADKAADVIISQVDDPKKRAVLEQAWKSGFTHHEDLLDDATRTIAKSLDETLEAGRKVDMASFGESKSNQMAKLVPAENAKAAQAAALYVNKEARDVVDFLNSLASKGDQAGSLKRVENWLDDFSKVPTSQWKDPAALFDKLDDFKRRIGKEAAFGRLPFGKTEAASQFEKLYGKLQSALEDEATWGPAAIAQKEINAATTDMLGTSEFFNGQYTTRFDHEAGVPIFRAKPAAIDGFVKSLTKPANDLNVEAFAEKIARRQNFLDAVERNYSFPADVKRAIAAERKALERMGETIAKTSNEVAQVNQLKRIMEDERGHGIGGIVGVALDAVSKPGHTLARLAELEATKNRALAKLDKGVAAVKTAMSGRKKPGLTPKLSDEAPDTYEKRRAVVLAAAGKPDDAHAHISSASAPISPSAPATAQAFQRAGLRTIQYLMTVLPKPQPRPGSLTPQVDMEAWQPSDQQKAQFNRRFDAATNPDHVLHLVAAGTVTKDHVDALKATRPAMYDAAAKKLQADLSARTKPVPFEMQAPIKTFLGLPQMDPQIQRLMQANYQSAPPKSKALNRPIKMSDTTSLNANKE